MIGPVLGAVFLGLAAEILLVKFRYLYMLGLGLALIVVVLLCPRACRVSFAGSEA